MGYDVSSWFKAEAVKTRPQVRRRYTLGGSDYSERVLKWPSVARAWDDVRPLSINLDLANEDGELNLFHEEKSQLETRGTVEVGFADPFWEGRHFLLAAESSYFAPAGAEPGWPSASLPTTAMALEFWLDAPYPGPVYRESGGIGAGIYNDWGMNTAGYLTLIDSSASQSVLHVASATLLNGYVETRTDHVGDGGLVLRYVDDSNYYLATIQPSTGADAVRFYKRVGGAFTLISSHALGWTDGDMKDFRFEVSSNQLVFYMDSAGQLSSSSVVCTASDDALLQGGAVGLRANKGSNDYRYYRLAYHDSDVGSGALDDFHWASIQTSYPVLTLLPLAMSVRGSFGGLWQNPSLEWVNSYNVNSDTLAGHLGAARPYTISTGSYPYLGGTTNPVNDHGQYRHHVAAMVSADSGPAIYIDGVEMYVSAYGGYYQTGSYAGYLMVDSSLIYSGSAFLGGGNGMFGLHDVRLYNQTLSADEVAAHMVGSYTGPAPVVHWPMSETVGAVSSVADVGSYGLHLELAAGSAEAYSGAYEEYVQLFRGRTSRVQYRQGKVTLSHVDKLATLSDRVVGTSEQPVTYTGSNYNPAHLIWWLATSYGGLSTAYPGYNPDIDTDAYNALATYFSDNGVTMRAHFENIKVMEALRKIGALTRTALLVEGDRLYMARWLTVNSAETNLDGDSIIDVEVSIDEQDMANRQYVLGQYNTSSRDWGITVYAEDAASVNSFGLREEVEKDESVWYVDSASALDLAQRIELIRGTPYDKVNVTTVLAPLPRQIGETVVVEDLFLGLSGGYRLMGYKLNLDDGTVELDVDASQISNGFQLDVSTLGGGEVLL